MLNKRVPDLNEIIWDAAAVVGLDPAKITDRIIRSVCPRTLAEAEIEGFDRMLRAGLIDFVKRKLRTGAARLQKVAAAHSSAAVGADRRPD